MRSVLQLTDCASTRSLGCLPPTADEAEADQTRAEQAQADRLGNGARRAFARGHGYGRSLGVRECVELDRAALLTPATDVRRVVERVQVARQVRGRELDGDQLT